MSRLRILGARVMDPSRGVDERLALDVEDGRIVALEASPGGPADETLEVDGLWLVPGFVDLHTHLREPGLEYKETVETGTRAAARGGFTTVCAMPNTEPPLDSRPAIESLLREVEASAIIRVLPIGCITRGRAGHELAPAGELAAAGVVALSDDGDAVNDARLMRHALEYSTRFNLPVAQHCEDARLVLDGQMHEGWVATRLGLRGRPASAEETFVARDIALAELTGAHLHICHVSTAGSVALIRAARERGAQVTAEVTPHHLTLTHEEVAFGNDYASLIYNTNAKVNPPLREERDVEALAEALRDGVIDAIATDHAPHAAMDKEIEFDLAAPGMSMLETALGLCLRLVHDGTLSLPTLIERLTTGPVRTFHLERPGLEGIGTLAPGAVGDVTIIDPNEEWVVDPERFHSTGHNTPLTGKTLRGRVIATIAGGTVVHQTERMAALT